jgi:hypothetical protein
MERYLAIVNTTDILAENAKLPIFIKITVMYACFYYNSEIKEVTIRVGGPT